MIDFTTQFGWDGARNVNDLGNGSYSGERIKIDDPTLAFILNNYILGNLKRQGVQAEYRFWSEPGTDDGSYAPPTVILFGAQLGAGVDMATVFARVDAVQTRIMPRTSLSIIAQTFGIPLNDTTIPPFVPQSEVAPDDDPVGPLRQDVSNVHHHVSAKYAPPPMWAELEQKWPEGSIFRRYEEAKGRTIEYLRTYFSEVTGFFRSTRIPGWRRLT